jgi:hypothetical protein
MVFILLRGGWDSALGTDPIIGEKISGGYEPDYQSVVPVAVPGKSNLVVGAGLAAATGAFASIPTAFVNGMFMEVTAHSLAEYYMYSGRLSLSLSREYPALGALFARKRGGFPSHLVLGARMPLGDTVQAAPPIHTSDLNELSKMLNGPHETANGASGASFQLVEDFIKRADLEFGEGKVAESSLLLEPWINSQASLSSLYNADFGSKLALSPETRDRYGIPQNRFSGIEAYLAGTYLALKNNLTNVVTLNVGGFDTHQDHLNNHVPLLNSVAEALNVFVKDLRETPDPLDPSRSLADGTLICVTSEFVRTPMFNGQNGTDHWRSASAILMGNGVKDNVVLGKTDSNGEPLGWREGRPQVATEETHLLPNHFAASLLDHLGMPEEANEISTERLNGLFE